MSNNGVRFGSALTSCDNLADMGIASAYRAAAVVGVVVVLPPLELLRIRGRQYNCHPNVLFAFG